MDKIKEIPQLELAFKNQEFSGIVIGEFLIEEGEVINYIHSLLSKIKEFKEKIKKHKTAIEKMMYYDRWDGKKVVRIADEELYKR